MRQSVIKFLSGNKGSGILLIFCVILSLALANSAFKENFLHILEYELGFSVGSISLEKSVTHWINDLLMAVFFLLVGAEVKREIVEGELSTVRKAILPVVAAVGGVVVPIAIYMALNYNNEMTRSGWAVPMATDIAFALSILSLAGNVPWQVRLFLTSLAIADDLAAILVIALFYGEGVSAAYLGYALLVMAGLFVLNRMNVKKLWCYLLPGIILWYFVYKSGIHATIAGVLLAFMIPLGGHATDSPLERLEHSLHRPVNYFIIPIFAIANTAISLSFNGGELFSNTGAMGILYGLVAGKFIGITLFSYIAVKLGASLPERFRWDYILGVGFLGGVGFTMSIFISLLAFNDPHIQEVSKLSVLLASLISGVAGFFLVRRSYRKQESAKGRK